MTTPSQVLLFALAGGILPTLAWLWFWLREDSVHPEPRWMLTLAFIGGMITSILVYPFEVGVIEIFGSPEATSPLLISIVIVFLWAAIEEMFKFIAAYTSSLRKPHANEPVDMIIYMIVVALGFAALENSLFLLGPLKDGNLIESIATGNMRFIGSTLLHTLASATIGFSMALAFYKNKRTKIIYWIIGMIAAIALHTMFNLFIMRGTGNVTLAVFSSVWLLLTIIILFFEKIKKIYPLRNKLN